MATLLPQNFTLRKNFGKIEKIIDFPDLVDIQKSSYERFLQSNIPPNERTATGLQGVFQEIFPIKDFNETASLEFVNYILEPPKYDVDECRQRGMTYSAPMKVTARLVIYWDKDPETGERAIRDVKEQEIYFGEIPLITETGTFIINGTERVVVSQLHRSPGAFFEQDKGKTQASEKLIFAARIIPYRGSWLDFEFDMRDIIHVRIDRRRKMHATILLKALDYTDQQLLNYYYNTEVIVEEKGRYKKKINFDILQGQFATRDIKHPSTGEIIIAKNRKFTRKTIKDLKQAKISEIPIDEEELIGKYSATDIVDKETGEVILKCNEEITKKKLADLKKAGIDEFKVLFIDKLNVGAYLRDTLAADGVSNKKDAITLIYKRLRPGEPTTDEAAEKFFNNLFFNPERYDLGQVGRLKLNHKFGLDEPLTNTVLTKKDILEVVKYLIDLKNGRGSVDDIDHLGNRRVRSVGELLENQFRIGLVRMERAIKEKMSLQEMETMLPHDLINSKPVNSVVKEFFGSSQLSQFMDQTNPLSEITHKRRLSALGPGGLTRERAGFEVRDVHPTHYGRICPVETPEGPNIGLIASLSTYARVTKYGFVETPYREVEKGVVTKRVNYYSALQEEAHTIAQANTKTDSNNKIAEKIVAARQRQGDLVMVAPEEVSLMDVSPNQIVSAAASLIPFLEHDDANRALMGSNMQRQAVPLIRTEAPIVGTGMEMVVAANSGVTIVAKRSGVVQSVDATRIVVRADEAGDEAEGEVDVYMLTKFQRSNQNTCLNQKPLVREGERIKAGDVIADGPATENGELALGKNVVVAFMPWGGYNFEDSILINERVVKDDAFTSIHIEEFECISRDTKLGKEEITRDIPNVGEEALGNLDESGIIRIGAEVKPGDILVGKITPKGETQLSPEEKLLRAIFGEKAGDVRDTSLRVPPGVSGTVINAKVFLRKGTEKDERTLSIEREEEERIRKNLNDKKKISWQLARQKIEKILKNKTTAARLTGKDRKVLLQKGVKLTAEILAEIPDDYLGSVSIGNEKEEKKIQEIISKTQENIQLYTTVYEEKIKRLKRGDELPPGVIKMIKVYIAIKRKLQVGDKMAGRHGNKGVISRILPEEDMPFLADGTPVDVVLNPLGVPSRMNVGQVLETHLGWAAKGIGEKIAELANQAYSPASLKRHLNKIYTDKESRKAIDSLSDEQLYEFAKKLGDGIKVATPVFDGAKENEIFDWLNEAGLERDGQTVLFDGRTGEPFSNDVTVGVMYILKLHHLVEDKIHARSIGPYSLVTQQPLGGKAQFGGQRLGEMEVWAIEAYGAAYSLREFLTVKSDDVVGRTKMFEAIVKGEQMTDINVPESFNVLVKEMQSLGLDVQLLEKS